MWRLLESPQPPWAAAVTLVLRLRSASSSRRAALKPLCCGPVSARRFRSALGSLHPAAQPPDVGLRPSPLTGGVSGVLASSVARWAQMLDGDRPRGLPMVAGGGAAFTAVAGSREAREWAKIGLHAIRGARVQIRRRVARSRVPRGHIKTRHHSVCSGHSPRVPRSPTNDP